MRTILRFGFSLAIFETVKYLLIISWFVVFCLIMKRWKFFKDAEIPWFWLCFLLGLKVVAGFLYGKLFLDHYGGGDPYKVFKAGLYIFNSYGEDPGIYFRLIFGPNGGFAEVPVYKYAYQTGYWDHSGFFNIARLHAIIRPLTFGYYSVHITFMAFFMMIGSLHFFRLLKDQDNYSKWPVLSVVFLMPSLLFWTGGFHKDGFVYLGIGIVLYHVHRYVQIPKIKHLLFLFLGLWIIALVRPFQLALVLPPLLLAVSVLKWKGKVFWKFAVGYLLLPALAILLSSVIEGFDILEILVARQHAFLVENGGSSFFVGSLEATVSSFLTFFPTASVNGFFRPFVWDANGTLQFFSSIGILAFWLFLIFTIYFRRANFRWSRITLFLFFYSVSNIFLIGYLVSNSGTLVRYRSVSLNLLLIVMVLVIDWKRVRSKWIG
ncbi:MAG: hypothetical protein AAF502_04480 [Bacteroidota bacterium]